MDGYDCGCMAFGGRSFPDAEQEVPEQEGPSELETDAELFIVAQLISRRLALFDLQTSADASLME